MWPLRRIFATETVAIALAGWLIGLPLGALIDRVLVWLVKQIANVDIPASFPLGYLAPTLAATVVLALVITLLPIRRAVRLQPCDALRYA